MHSLLVKNGERLAGDVMYLLLYKRADLVYDVTDYQIVSAHGRAFSTFKRRILTN